MIILLNIDIQYDINVIKRDTMSDFKKNWLKTISSEEELENRLRKKFQKLKEGSSCQFFINDKAKYLHKINGKAKISDNKIL